MFSCQDYFDYHFRVYLGMIIFHVNIHLTIKKYTMKKIKFVLLLVVLYMFTGCKEEKKQVVPVDREVDLVLYVKSKLGEGAIWHPGEKKLYWVDIESGYLYIYDPVKEFNQGYNLGQKVGTVVPVEGGGVLVALKSGLFTFDLSTESLEFKVFPEEKVIGNRLNDGKCDPRGRFWVGSMSLDGDKKTGALYKVESDFSYEKMIDQVYISNGIAWSIDERKMYYNDSPLKKVVTYDYNKKKGEISNPVDAIHVPDSLGMPDGCTLDAEGKLWIAMHGGACVTRWDTETGELLDKIDIPALNVTSCAFGDKNLETLYITTSSMGLTHQQRVDYPLSGGVFAVKPGVRGVESYLFKKK